MAQDRPSRWSTAIRYGLVKQAPSAAPLPANAKTPVDGLQLPEAIASKFVAPTIEGKPQTEFLDRRLELLVSLLSAKRRGVFTAPKEVVETDPQRFKLMSSRLDKALATVSGASVALGPEGTALVPGEEAKLAAVLYNGGVAEIQVKQLKFRGLGLETKLNTAEKILPGTDTSAEVRIVTPKNAQLSVPASEHLYDGRLFGEKLNARSRAYDRRRLVLDQQRVSERHRAGR